MGTNADPGFAHLRQLLHDGCGIVVRPDRHDLVQARLMRRLRALHLPDLEAYVERLMQDDAELSHLVDALTTNKTSFFRERAHFRFLRDHISDLRARFGPLRVWSAACSSGEEPYSLSILLHQLGLPADSFRILATDISSTMLGVARQAVYPAGEIDPVPPSLRSRWPSSPHSVS